MSLGKLATERPVTLAMTALAVVIFGFVALTRLPVSLLPDVSYPTLTVEAKLPGAAPVEVESLLAKPIEEAVGVVSGVERITSNSRPGLVDVSLEFGWGRDMDVAAMDVRQKLDLVTLPKDAEKPRVLRYDPTEDPVVRIGVTGSHNLARLRYYAESVLKKRLDAVDGVAAIKILGGEIQEIQVDLDEGRLQEMGLTHADVVRALASSNVNVAGGSLYEDEARYLVRTSNELQTPEDVAAIPLVSPLVKDRSLALRDVATVKMGSAEREVIARLGGREAVELQVFKEGDSNAVRVAERFGKALEEAKKALPPELRTVVIYDQSRFIKDAIGEVDSNAIAGGVIAIMVLLLFLRDVRSTLIISLSIPISIVATFFVMYQLGVSLNVMSLGGLALGVGMVVDDSIVVLEAIMKRREAGESLLVASINGTQEISMAVMATTLTTVVVFVPLIFLHGVAAQLFRDQAITVTASLLASLVVSLTLIPMLCSRGARSLLAGTTPANKPGRGFRLTAFLITLARKVGRTLISAIRLLAWPIDRLFSMVWLRLERAYPSLLAIALGRPWSVLGLGLAISVLAFLPAIHLPLDLIPPLHEGEILINLQAPEGTALDGTAHLAEGLEKTLASSPLVASVFTTVGGESQHQASVVGSGQNLAQLHVVLKNRGKRSDEASVMALARQTLGEAPGLVYHFDRPGSFSLRSPIEVEIYGDDVASLVTVAQDLTSRLGSLPFLSDVKTDARLGNPEVQIRFDRERLAELGLEPSTVAEALRGRLQGEVATRVTEGDRDVDVRVRTRGLAHSSPEDLAALPVANVAGAPVALGEVAKVIPGTGPSEIRRIGQRRAAVITANLAGLDLGSASQRIRETLASYPLPSGIYPPELSGQSKELGRSMRELVFALILATFLVYFVMASEFESLLHPLMIMLTVPIGVAGSLFALWITGQPLSVVAIIGIVLLVGIVVDNAIILVDCANQRRRAGMTPRDAMVEAGRLRLRPIMMTMATEVLGLFPMALGFGNASELRMPLAISVMGGLSICTMLTLVVIPCLYLLVEHRGRVPEPVPARVAALPASALAEVP